MSESATEVVRPRRTRTRRPVRVVAAVVAVVVVVTAVGVWLSPIGGRWRAAAADQPPVEGVTTVDIVDSTFTPAALSVPVGTEVTWRWTDDQAHDVSFPEASSSQVRTTGAWSRTFDRPGEYRFRCTLHLFMDGRVVVTAR